MIKKLYNKTQFQTQCSWTIESPPGTRIRIDFEDFKMWKTGLGCETAYLKLSTSLPGEIQSKFFKLCGKNPGLNSNVFMFG